MASLKQVLAKSEATFLEAGGGASPSVKKALKSHRAALLYINCGLTLLVLCSVVFCIYLLLEGRTQLSRLVAALLGIGSGGGIEALRRTWQNWSQTNLLLILVEDATEAQVTSIVKKLVDKL